MRESRDPQKLCADLDVNNWRAGRFRCPGSILVPTSCSGATSAVWGASAAAVSLAGTVASAAKFSFGRRRGSGRHLLFNIAGFRSAEALDRFPDPCHCGVAVLELGHRDHAREAVPDFDQASRGPFGRQVAELGIGSEALGVGDRLASFADPWTMMLLVSFSIVKVFISIS